MQYRSEIGKHRKWHSFMARGAKNFGNSAEPTREINATDIIWDFFQNHPKEVTEHIIYINGFERTYYVHKAYPMTELLPLLVVLHAGGGGNALGTVLTYGFWDLVEKGEMIAVYPDAMPGSWGTWNPFEPSYDIEFIDTIIDDTYLEEKARLRGDDYDRGNLFITGASNGGLMTFVMSQASKHCFTAAGTVIATQMQYLADEFPFTRPINFAMIAGTEDPLMPYYGRWMGFGEPLPVGPPDEYHLPVEDVIDTLVDLNEITDCPIIYSLNNTNPDDNCTNEVRLYINSMTNRSVILVKVIGGGHVVPGGSQYLPPEIIGPACTDFNHAEVMWHFFVNQTGQSIGQITINGNYQSSSHPSVKGSGTWADPYVIEDISITGVGCGAGIRISNTNKLLIIQNCIIKNFSDGISLSNVSNVIIQGNSSRKTLKKGWICGMKMIITTI